MSKIEAFLKAADVLSVIELEEALRVLQEKVRASRALIKNSESGLPTISENGNEFPSNSHNGSPANSGNELPSNSDNGSSAILDNGNVFPSNSNDESPANSSNAFPSNSDNGPPAISDNGSPVNSSNGSPANSDNALSPIPEVEKLFQTLDIEKTREGIKEFLSSSPLPDFARGWFAKDPRLVDCKRSPPNYEENLRRALSQRSMASEYDTWEREKFATSRVDSVSRNVANIKDSGHITEFVEFKGYEEDDINTATHGIKHDIRLLVFERMYGVPGTSAIFMFISTCFRSVKYESYSTLKHRLLGEEFWKDFVEKASDRLIQCQEQYDVRWVTKSRGRKRQREASPASYYFSPQTPSTITGRPNIEQQVNNQTPDIEPVDTPNDFTPFQQPILGPSNTHTSNGSWSLPQVGRTDIENHALMFNASYESVSCLNQPIWRQQPSNYMGNQTTQTATNGAGNSEPDTISPCVYPQYIPIDTMESSTFPYFLPQSIGAEDYLEYVEPPRDTMVPSNFPRLTPESATQYTINDNRETDTQSTFARQDDTSSFIPRANGIGISVQ
ncbi:hypothetical protein N7486_005986 [Penicillium sp. IBT 16267x]|nr:hypothetical protein N7486_005986 [Penicillium sp. IBT 16267x]